MEITLSRRKNKFQVVTIDEKQNVLPVHTFSLLEPHLAFHFAKGMEFAFNHSLKGEVVKFVVEPNFYPK
jgi:hypothetical protein